MNTWKQKLALLLAALLAGCAGAPPAEHYSSKRDLLGEKTKPAPAPEKPATP